LLGLLAYPFAVERALSVPAQAAAFAGLFLVFVGLLAAASRAGQGTRAAADPGPAADPRAEPARMLLWLLLAAAPSAMLMALTTHLCQEVAAVPLLWVLPLAIYLLSFMICFDRPGWYRRR